jgi:hypothetical protein
MGTVRDNIDGIQILPLQQLTLDLLEASACTLKMQHNYFQKHSLNTVIENYGLDFISQRKKKKQKKLLFY